MSDRTPSTYGREVWGANDVEAIVQRNADWITRFITAGVKAVMKDGRPLFTMKTSEAERLAALLTAPTAFWDANTGLYVVARDRTRLAVPA